MSIPITLGSGAASVAAEAISGLQYQQVEIYGAGGSSVLSVAPDGSFKASVIGTPTVLLGGGSSPASIATVKTLGTQVVSGDQGLVVNAALHGITSAGGGSYVDVKVDPSGALVTTASSVVAYQGGTQITSLVSTVPSSVLVGASIFGALPAGTNSLGSVAAFQGGTWAVQVSNSPTVNVGNLASVLGYVAPVASWVSAVTSVITTTALTSVFSAAGGSIKNYVTHIIATNGAATGTFVDIVDGGGNVLYSGYAAASGGGFSSHINPPLVGSANKSVDAKTRSQGSVIVAMTGYTA